MLYLWLVTPMQAKRKEFQHPNRCIEGSLYFCWIFWDCQYGNSGKSGMYHETVWVTLVQALERVTLIIGNKLIFIVEKPTILQVSGVTWHSIFNCGESDDIKTQSVHLIGQFHL